MVFNAAIQACHDRNAVLATIVNFQDFEITIQLCKATGYYCYFGLHRNSQNPSIWEYIDGTPVNNLYGFDSNGHPTTGSGPWHSGEPNFLHEGCAAINRPIYTSWLDLGCQNTLRPICQRNQIGSSPTISPSVQSEIPSMLSIYCIHIYVYNN